MKAINQCLLLLDYLAFSLGLIHFSIILSVLISHRQEAKKNAVDLQLPEIVGESYYAPEVVISKPEVTFKEKVVTLSNEGDERGSNVGFKKRKAQQDNRKIMRRRNDL